MSKAPSSLKQSHSPLKINKREWGRRRYPVGRHSFSDILDALSFRANEDDSKNPPAEKPRRKSCAHQSTQSLDNAALQESPRFLLSRFETRSSPSSSSASTKSLESPEGENLGPCTPKLTSIQDPSDGGILASSKDMGSSSRRLNQIYYHRCQNQASIWSFRKRAVSLKQKLPGQFCALPQNEVYTNKENLRPKRKMRRILSEIEMGRGQSFGAKSYPIKLYNQLRLGGGGGKGKSKSNENSCRSSLVSAATTPAANFKLTKTFSQKLELPLQLQQQEEEGESHRELTAFDLSHENGFKKEYDHVKLRRRSVSSTQTLAGGKEKFESRFPRGIRQPAALLPLPSPPPLILKHTQSDPYSLITNSKLQIEIKERQASILKRSQSATLSRMQPVIHSNTNPKLPIVKTNHEGVQAISARTVAQLLEGKFFHLFDKVILCDARYPYEYDGGHIRGAVCTTLPSSLDQLLFNNNDIMNVSLTYQSIDAYQTFYAFIVICFGNVRMIHTGCVWSFTASLVLIVAPGLFVTFGEKIETFMAFPIFQNSTIPSFTS